MFLAPIVLVNHWTPLPLMFLLGPGWTWKTGGFEPGFFEISTLTIDLMDPEKVEAIQSVTGFASGKKGPGTFFSVYRG